MTPCIRCPSLQDGTLQELYISQTRLTGSLPDVVPANSPLRLLYAINYLQPSRTGFTGGGGSASAAMRINAASSHGMCLVGLLCLCHSADAAW